MTSCFCFTDMNNFPYAIPDFNDLIFVFLRITMIVTLKELYNSSFVFWFLVLQYFLYILFLALIGVRIPLVIQGFYFIFSLLGTCFWKFTKIMIFCDFKKCWNFQKVWSWAIDGQKMIIPHHLIVKMGTNHFFSP